MSTQPTDLFQAVRNEDQGAVEALVKSGAAVDIRDRKQQTPLLIAAVTDQYRIANFLYDSGADPMAMSKFGWTPAFAAQGSNLAGGPEFEALEQFKEKLRQQGIEFPVPDPDAMLAGGA